MKPLQSTDHTWTHKFTRKSQETFAKAGLQESRIHTPRTRANSSFEMKPELSVSYICPHHQNAGQIQLICSFNSSCFLRNQFWWKDHHASALNTHLSHVQSTYAYVTWNSSHRPTKLFSDKMLCSSKVNTKDTREIPPSNNYDNKTTKNVWTTKEGPESTAVKLPLLVMSSREKDHRQVPANPPSHHDYNRTPQRFGEQVALVHPGSWSEEPPQTRRVWQSLHSMSCIREVRSVTISTKLGSQEAQEGILKISEELKREWKYAHPPEVDSEIFKLCGSEDVISHQLLEIFGPQLKPCSY